MLVKIIDIMIDGLIKVRSHFEDKNLSEEDEFWMDELAEAYRSCGY